MTPQSSYAQHILQNLHEYGSIADTMSLLRCIHKTSVLISYEQLFIQTFYHNGNFITEQGTGEQNPLFQLAIDTMLMSATTWKQNRSTCHLQHTQISSNSSMTAADNSMGTYIIHYSIELIAFSTEYTLFNNCNFNLVYRYSLSVSLTISFTV
jgi:hypothetical protein